MWAQYRKTALAMQIVIWLVTLLAYLIAHRPWQQVVACFLVMQFGAVAGAVWASRIRGKVEHG